MPRSDWDTSVEMLYDGFREWHRWQTRWIARPTNTRSTGELSLLYDGGELIGEGKYARVFGKGRLAYKVVRMGRQRDTQHCNLLRCHLKELCLLHSLGGASGLMQAVRSQCLMSHGHFVRIVHELPRADTTLEQDPPRDQAELLSVVTEVASALQHLHHRNLTHGDVKPANILRGGDRVTLTDFTLASFVDRGEDISFGSLFWRAPETLSRVGYGRPADVWSLGVIVLDCLYGCCFMRDVLQGETNQDLLWKVSQFLIDPEPLEHFRHLPVAVEMTPEELDGWQRLVSDMLRWEPTERIDIDRVLARLDPSSTPSLLVAPPPGLSCDESLVRRARACYFTTFGFHPPPRLDWIHSEVAALCQRLTERLQEVKCSHSAETVMLYCAQVLYFLHLGFYPHDDELFESAVFHLLHLLDFRIFSIS